jgi:hypothetical protein
MKEPLGFPIMAPGTENKVSADERATTNDNEKLKKIFKSSLFT